MRLLAKAMPLALVLTGACVETATTTVGGGTARTISEVPEPVREAAAPFQDLSTVVLREDDGCYWYLHRGPVEATYLPLRTPDGRPICARAPEPVTAEG